MNQRTLSVFDRATQGLSDERKSEVMNVIMTLGLDLNSPEIIVLAVYGYLKQVGEEIPDKIAAAVQDLYAKVDGIPKRLDDAITTAFDDGVAATRAAATAMGSAELSTFRIAFAKTAQDELRKVLGAQQRAIPEPLKWLTAMVVLVVAVVLIGIGFTAGHVSGARTAVLTRDERLAIRRVELFHAMYHDMPDSMVTWTDRWMREHSRPMVGDP